MAPPTVSYNNTSARFTKYEQRNVNNIVPTEVAIAKSMLTRDIDVFTTGVNSISDKDITTTYANTINYTDSNERPRSHLMINHQQNDLGTVFALAAQHVNNDNSITTTSEYEGHTRHTSFNIPHGKLGNAGGIGSDYNIQNQVTVNDNSASYYDSQLAFISRQEFKTGTNPDGTEKVSTNSGTIGGGSFDAGVKVVWNGGTSNPNLNAQRAVNSIYSTWGSAISGGAGVTGNAIGNQDHPMQFTENTNFNQNYSLYTEKLIQRNSSDGSLTSNNANITNAISTLTNGTDNYYSGLVGIHPDMLSGKGLTGIGRNTPGLTGMQNGVPDNGNMTAQELAENSKTEKGTLNYNVVYGVTGTNSTNNCITHEAMFFGSIKAVQDNENNSITVFGNMIEKPDYDALGVTGFSFTRVPAGTTTGSGLAPYGNYLEPNIANRPGNKFTASRLLGSTGLGVTGLFTPTDANYVFDSYELGITGIPGGGYSFSTAAVTAGATGITIDDNSLVRNIQYMSTCKNNATATSGWSGHTVEITNGSFTLGTTGITNSVNSDLVTVNYNSEILGQAASTSQFIVETYATTPSAYAGSSMPRASPLASTNQDFGYTGTTASTNFIDYLVQYESSVENIDGDGTNIGNLGITGRNVSFYEHEIACIFPATGLGKTGTWNSTNYIGVDKNFTALVRHNGGALPNNNTIATSINVPGDFTFTATDAGVTGVGGPLSNNVVRFDIMNQAIMSQENSMYAEGGTEPISGTSVSAIGENVSLHRIGLNAGLNNTTDKVTDLRLKLTAKSGLETTLTNGWTWGPATGTLATSMPNKNIFGNDIYSMTNGINITSTDTIPMSINLAGTSSSFNNRDELFLKATVAWTYLSSTKEFMIPEELITLSNLTQDTESTTHISTGFTINTSGNQTISNLLSKYYLIKRTRTRSFKPQFILPIGPYSNLQVTGAQITMVDEYYTLESATDGTGTRLADSYLRFYSVGGFSYMASRTLSGNTSTYCDLYARDLIGFTSNAQYIVNNTGSWTDISGSTSLFDPAFNNTYTLSLGSNAGTITVSGDITNGNGITNLDQSTYYVSLSTSNIADSYKVSAKIWNSEADFINLSTWSQANGVTSPTIPDPGTAIDGLVANVSYDYTGVSGMVQQPNVVISIGQTVSNNFVEWFNFKTSSDNATSNLLVYYAPRPVFKIRRAYGDLAVTKDTYYKMAESLTHLKVEDGIRLKFINTVGQKASARYKLRGDRIWAYAYTGYNGPFFRYDGTPSEVTFSSGLTIGDASSITMVLKHYRGNSVRHNSLVTGQTTVSNMAQSPYSATTFSEFGLNRQTVYETALRAYYERFTWNRTASSIKLQVDMNGDIYSSTATHLFNGSTHTVNNLLITSGLTDLGAIGLKFNGLYSRYAGQTTYTKSFKLTVTGATYSWFIKNPNRVDQYSNTPIIRDSNEDVIPEQNTLKTGVAFTALPGSYLVKTGSGTKSALDYELFTGMLSNSFVAGKVKITTNEAYSFKYTVPPLYLYYSPSYVGDPATFTDFKDKEFQRISQAALKSTTKAHIEVPAFYHNNDDNTFYSGDFSSGKKSIYVLNRRDVNIKDHVAYFVLPRPQYKFEAVSTLDITSLPYNLSAVTKRVRYVDAMNTLDEHSWNNGTRPERGYGTFSAFYTYNHANNQVNYYTKNPYFTTPFNSASDGINKSTIYNGSNYVRMKIAPNSTPAKIVVDSNNVRINLLQGYSNGENSTNVNSPGVYTYTPGNTYMDGTYSNNIVTIYNGPISGLLNATYYVDSSITPNKTTYLQGYYSGNGKYGIRFRQDTSIFSSDITTISGVLGNENYNIIIDGIMPFMCLESSKYSINNNAKTVDSFQSRHLDLLPGDTTKLILYGHTYDYDTVNNKLVANIIKYETATGIDFSSISGNDILMKNLVFKAGKKSTASVVIRENTNILGDEPFHLLLDTESAANSLSSLTWSEQTLSPSIDLAFTVTSLSKKGQGILTDILGTSQLSPYRCLVCSYPPRLELRSADGSPLYQVNAFGTLFNVRTHTNMVELIDSSMLGSSNVPFEYIAYNALKGNAL